MLRTCALAVALGGAASLVARLLTGLIALTTNLAFFGRFSFSNASPADHALGPWVVLVPVVGALLVGVMARYGASAIRGHGIPEAMERVLFHESRVPARIMFLKPLSAAISIGTGGPFGAEGPIIATGGALGSVTGQFLSSTADERKVLLAAGAAGGMAATFGSPISAVLLAVELLLFEYRPRSLVPVALAAAAATAGRMIALGASPAFAMPDIAPPTAGALFFYAALGVPIGLSSVGVTRLVYWIEDAFERLRLHWMWWPALGAIVVGLVGLVSPRTLGVGYTNIEALLGGELATRAMFALALFKLVSWSVALGSGTSGGTLAPLFTVGAALGGGIAAMVSVAFPSLGIDPRVAALVGMAAMFAGASRALLASIVFAFETTRQPLGLLPLLSGCTLAFLVSSLLMRGSIMTEKLLRRGSKVVTDYSVDHLAQERVVDHASRELVTVSSEWSLAEVRAWLASGAAGSSHQGFPVVDERSRLVGVITRRDVLETHEPMDTRVRAVVRAPIVAFDDMSLREAADRMVRAGVGRLPVVARASPNQLLGMLTRSDLLEAHGRRLDSAEELAPPRKLSIRRAATGASG